MRTFAIYVLVVLGLAGHTEVVDSNTSYSLLASTHYGDYEPMSGYLKFNIHGFYMYVSGRSCKNVLRRLRKHRRFYGAKLQNFQAPLTT